ncbi:Hypothetical protein PBC10988_30120 [Planctomycetales bacterium 10988]|nr:Hypothetical protein PBC10988_30120 [Planctomycetales bacterium 10988]
MENFSQVIASQKLLWQQAQQALQQLQLEEAKYQQQRQDLHQRQKALLESRKDLLGSCQFAIADWNDHHSSNRYFREEAQSINHDLLMLRQRISEQAAAVFSLRQTYDSLLTQAKREASLLQQREQAKQDQAFLDQQPSRSTSAWSGISKAS